MQPEYELCLLLNQKKRLQEDMDRRSDYRCEPQNEILFVIA
jgi:hypothetical protein